MPPNEQRLAEKRARNTRKFIHRNGRVGKQGELYVMVGEERVVGKDPEDLLAILLRRPQGVPA